MGRAHDFTRSTQRKALERQKNLCAACGTPISSIGGGGQADHQFGEGARAHHIVHIKSGGTRELANCVIICESCHYCVHEGGNYRHGTVDGTPQDFPHFNGEPVLDERNGE